MSFRDGLRKLAYLKNSAETDEYDMDDLIICDEKIDIDGDKLNYLLFEFNRDTGYGRYEKVYKAIKMVKIKRVPKKDLTLSSFLQMQEGVVAGSYQEQINYLQIFANIIYPERLGLIFGYGVQGVSSYSYEDAKHLADVQMASLERNITGTFRTLEYCDLTAADARWIFNKLGNMKEMRVIRGVPVPKKTNGRIQTNTFASVQAEDVEEQSEEFLMGMDDYEYLFVLTATSVNQSTISKWKEANLKEASYYAGIHTGQKSMSFGVSMPMVYAANLSSGQNWGESQGKSYGENWGQSHSTGNSLTDSVGVSHGLSTSHSVGTSLSKSLGTSVGNTVGESLGSSHNVSSGTNSSYGTNSSMSHGTSMSESVSNGVSSSKSHSVGSGFSQGTSTSSSFGGSRGTGVSSGSSFGLNAGSGHNWSKNSSESSSWSDSRGFGLGVQSFPLSYSRSNGWGGGTSHGNSDGHSTSLGSSFGLSNGVSSSVGSSWSNGVGSSTGISNSISDSTSTGTSSSYGLGRGISDSISSGISNSVGSSFSQGAGTSYGQSTSSNMGVSQSTSQGISESYGTGESFGTSQSRSVGQSTSDGTSTGQSVGTTDSSTTGHSTSSGSSSSLGLGPSISFARTFQWEDLEVAHLLDLLKFSCQRLIRASNNEGMWFTDIYIATESEEAASAATALSMSAWHGSDVLTSPLQVYKPSPHEKDYLMKHMSVFSPSVIKEGIPGEFESYKYTTLLLSDELAAYSHPPRANIGGIQAAIDDPPILTIPSNRQNGEIFIGYVADVEKYSKHSGYKSRFKYCLSGKELHHAYISGASRSGKTVVARRMVAEAYAHVRRGEKKKRLRFLIMDPKQDWRSLAKIIPSDHFRFYSLSDPEFHPAHLNLMKIPKGVYTERYADKLREIFIRSYGLGDRGFSILGKAINEVYREAGCFEPSVKYNRFDPKTGTYPATERSKNISLAAVCAKLQTEAEDPATKRDKAEAIQRIVDRMESFNEPDSTIYEIFCKTGDEGLGIDDLLGADDVIVLESYGMDTKTSAFVFGLLTSTVYQYAVSNGGFVEPENQYETILVIEEANQVLIGNEDTDNLGGANPFEVILDQSAGYGLFIWTLTQKIADMPDSVLANSAIKIIGRQDRKDDIDTSIVQIGKDGKIVDRVFKNWLPDQPIGWFIIKSSRNGSFSDNAPVHVMVEYLNIPSLNNEELDDVLRLGEVKRVNDEIEKYSEDYKTVFTNDQEGLTERQATQDEAVQKRTRPVKRIDPYMPASKNR